MSGFLVQEKKLTFEIVNGGKVDLFLTELLFGGNRTLQVASFHSREGQMREFIEGYIIKDSGRR